jgi:heme-degrading monooxygenase HmoA
MLVDMYRVSCLDVSATEDIAGALKRIQEGFKGTQGRLRQRLLRDLERQEKFIVVSYWRDRESLAKVSTLYAAIDEALDRLKVRTTSNAYDIIQDL